MPAARKGTVRMTQLFGAARGGYAQRFERIAHFDHLPVPVYLTKVYHRGAKKPLELCYNLAFQMKICAIEISSCVSKVLQIFRNPTNV
jgi:hypothetical protein